jgi:DegV family protein with EDD domain
MANYVVSCCSTADLSAEHFASRDIRVAFFHFSVDGKDYPDDLGVSYPFKKFYEDMEKGSITKTSQLSVGEYLDYFTPILQEGKDILHVTLSSGLSGTINSANTAVSILKDKFPERKIYIVDSLCASSGAGLYMTLLSQKRAEGMDIDALYQWALDNQQLVQHWFCSTDLTYYIKGGRVSKVSGVIGGIFEICPLLCVSPEGKLKPISKIRTKKKVLNALVDKMVQHAENGLDYSGLCYISHSDCIEDAKYVRDLIQSKFWNIWDIPIFDIGTTIGCHTGTGTVALFFTSNDEREDSR